MDEWTREQLAAAVEAYRSMEAKVKTEKVNKAQLYRELAKTHGRTAKAWEYRMQNISYVLKHELNQPWLDGLRPAQNVGAQVTSTLIELLIESSVPTVTTGPTRQLLEAVRAIQNQQEPPAPESLEDERRRVLATIVRRQGQEAFRTALLTAYRDSCAFTGCTVPDVLEAAHIKPYSGPRSNVVSNGILLRADVHTLFDLFLIGVDPESMKITVSPALRDTEYGALGDVRIATPAPGHPPADPAMLAIHRSQCAW